MRPLAAALLLALSLPAVAEQKKAEEKKPAPSLSQLLNRAFSVAEKDFIPLVEAMPEEKLDFAPKGDGFAGVRTFRQQVVHVTGTLTYVAAALNGQTPPSDEEQEVAPAQVKTKAQLVEWVRATFAQTHKAIDSVTADNCCAPISDKVKSARLGLAQMAAWHTFDHYGQLVIYARMNGVVPPASRPPPAK